MNYTFTERTIRPYPAERIDDFNTRMQRLSEILQTYDQSKVAHRIELQRDDMVRAVVRLERHLKHS